MIKIWVDDKRPMPEGYDEHIKTTWQALLYLGNLMRYLADRPRNCERIYLDLDHDASNEYAAEGGDYINILEALAHLKEYFSRVDGKPIEVHFHSANPVGVKNMRAIVENCPWMEEV